MTTPRNSYVTRTDFLQWATPQDTSADAVDDAVIDSILESVSRFFDGRCNRTFYPRVETQSYDTPKDRMITLDDDLLEVISVTNADGSAVASTDYHLIPKNTTPHYGIMLTKGSGMYWAVNTTDFDEYANDIAAFWGYRERYSAEAWKSAGTLAAAISDTTTLAFMVEAGYSIVAGDILKIDGELYIVDTVTADSAGVGTVAPLARGENGSTAATHLIATAVYKWVPQPDVNMAVKMIAQNVWRRFGVQAGQDENIITASGVVITPRDVPTVAALTIARLSRKT